MPTPLEIIGNQLDGQDDRSTLDKPVKIGGVARTTNPTAVASGKRVSSTYDKLGRQLVVPYQMRELISTARVTLTPGAGGNTETTLLAAPAGTFLDIYQITAVNASTATLGAATAVQIDIRDTTGGGIVHTMMVNNDDMRVVHFNPPLPQNTAAATWTIQAGPDLSTGGVITVSATFAQNT